MSAVSLGVFWATWMGQGWIVASNDGCLGEGCVRNGFAGQHLVGYAAYAAFTSVPYLAAIVFASRVPRALSTNLLTLLAMAVWLGTFAIALIEPGSIFITLLPAASILVAAAIAGQVERLRASRSGIVGTP